MDRRGDSKGRNLVEKSRAYHKAALRHHPDKAGKFLARSESGADVLRKLDRHMMYYPTPTRFFH
ncbi:DnaJ domain-containing protein [Artemisia annua]|uniref:DnaJ domain-containing protein n=1 Tax=Artemisia annua TaxID=35608 RepID=A0A2U1LYJ3_ARTAN|nr:DnaJ domain-containing protein [Artemisia annua]